MENEAKKPGLVEKLFGTKKEKKSSCCCNYTLEEVKEDKPENKDTKESQKPKKNSCCG